MWNARVFAVLLAQRANSTLLRTNAGVFRVASQKQGKKCGSAGSLGVVETVM